MSLTPKELEAISRVRKIMTEHFDSWIVTYRRTDENLISSINNEWHGDISDVVGLTTVSQARLLRICTEPAKTQS